MFDVFEGGGIDREIGLALVSFDVFGYVGDGFDDGFHGGKNTGWSA